MNPKSVTILGATGSVGAAAADVIAAHPERFAVQAVTALQNAKALAGLAVRLGARKAVIAEEKGYAALKSALSGTGIEAAAGEAALLETAAAPADITLNAIVGMGGLKPLMAAIERGGVIAIANKESLVAAGPLVLATAQRAKATILPVDSEHNAVFQILEPENAQELERIILTASGGPFRTASFAEMEAATPEQALKHPNWDMGAKISIDSATMMNKALEVIEAHYLFAVPPEKIDVLVHPQSVVHSMVEYTDGSLLAQMGAPDMRTPVAYALGWPERIKTPGARLNLPALSNMIFEEPDTKKFPFLPMAYEVLKAGPAFCVAMNAANEVAVQAFLDRNIGYMDIYGTVRRVLDSSDDPVLDTIDAILDFDAVVRQRASSYITNISGNPDLSSDKARIA